MYFVSEWFRTQRRDMNKYKPFCIAVLAGVLSTLILNYFISFEKFSFKKPFLVPNRKTSENKAFDKNNNSFVILWYSIPRWLDSFAKDFRLLKCKDVRSTCTLSTDNSDLNKSNVVIFSHFTLPKSPPVKHRSQIWIFDTLENKRFTHWPSSAWKNKFEWMMSYHRDADVSRPYGKIIELDKGTCIDRNYSEVFRQKTNFGVWMAGHCPTPSQREKYIKELQKYVAIDTFGACGKKRCGVYSPRMNECLERFSKEYKFLFSFENSICRDYSTEKVFNLYAYNLSIIPVVNGPPQASEYLPNGTFINALDFTSPESLANKLKTIGSDETLYTQYLKEKDKYTSKNISEIFQETMCTVCKNLKQFGEQKISINPNLKSVYKGGC